MIIKLVRAALTTLFIIAFVAMVVGFTGILISLPVLDILPQRFILPFVLAFASGAILATAVEHGGDEIMYHLHKREARR